MIKRKKKWDDAGQERILFAIIFLATMIFTTAFIITALQPIEYIASEQPNLTNWRQNMYISTWNPINGYKMNASRVMTDGHDIFERGIVAINGGWRWDYLKTGTHKIADFWPNNGHADDNTNVLVYAIEGQSSFPTYDPYSKDEWRHYTHYFVLYRHTGWWDEFFDCVDYDTVLANVDGNISITTVHLDRDYVFVINTNITNTTYNSFAEAFSAHDYYIYLGQYWQNMTSEIQQADFFSIIGMLLTFSLPGVPTTVSILIAVPCWICIGFIIFTLIERLIPG